MLKLIGIVSRFQNGQKEMTEMHTKEEIRKWLVNNNIAIVKACYQGSGDEGCVEEISFILEDGTEYQASWVDPPIKKEHMYCSYFMELANLIDSHVCNRFSGYENNEGGCGDWEWTIKNNIVRIDHSQYEIIAHKQHITTAEWMKEND